MASSFSVIQVQAQLYVQQQSLVRVPIKQHLTINVSHLIKFKDASSTATTANQHHTDQT